MKTIYRVNDEKITQTKAIEMVGLKHIQKMLRQANKDFIRDPEEEIYFYIGDGNMLNISFECAEMPEWVRVKG